MPLTITAEQRRARLGIRHHLAVPVSGLPPAEIARDVVALHATDPASVYLSVAARAVDLSAADIGRALYDDRTMIRMLGMRRTMFVVPTASASVVQHSSSDVVGARLRRALVKELGSVVADPEPWLAEVEDSVLTRLHEQGGATGAALSKADPRLRTKIVYAEGKAYGGPVAINSRVLNILSAGGRIVRGRPGGPAACMSGRPSRSGCPMDFPGFRPKGRGSRWCGCGWPGSAPGRSTTSCGGRGGTGATPSRRWR